MPRGIGNLDILKLILTDRLDRVPIYIVSQKNCVSIFCLGFRNGAYPRQRGGVVSPHTHCADEAPQSGTDGEVLCEVGLARSDQGGPLTEVAIVVGGLLRAVVSCLSDHLLTLAAAVEGAGDGWGR